MTGVILWDFDGTLAHRPGMWGACLVEGLTPALAAELADRAHARYVDVDTWRVFEDTRPALERLRARGWQNVVLSNHVPELPALAGALGLAEYFDAVVTSAATGYEKPHPEAFASGLRAAGAARQVWMVGDNYEADVAGAEEVGIPAVLARRADARAMRTVETLDELDAILD